jgi:hypothetical protein
MTTINYGLKGGTLDATKHIRRAIPRLCFPSEISHRNHQMAMRFSAVIESTPDRRSTAETN